MNAFTAEKARELTNISRNNHSAIINYIMYNAYIGNDFIMLEERSPYYEDAIEEKDNLLKAGYIVHNFTHEIMISWRQ